MVKHHLIKQRAEKKKKKSMQRCHLNATKKQSATEAIVFCNFYSLSRDKHSLPKTQTFLQPFKYKVQVFATKVKKNLTDLKIQNAII